MGPRSPSAPVVSIDIESPLWEASDLQSLTESAVDAALAEGGVKVAPGAEIIHTGNNLDTAPGARGAAIGRARSVSKARSLADRENSFTPPGLR